MNRDEFRFTQVLQKLDTFRDLDAEEARAVLGIARRRPIRAGEVLWKPGEESTDMLVLVSGLLAVTSREGEEIAKVKPGGSFGEMGLVTGHPRFVGVAARQDSLALSIGRAALQRLRRDQPELLIRILENIVDLLAHRLTHTRHENYHRATPTQGAEKIW